MKAPPDHIRQKRGQKPFPRSRFVDRCTGQRQDHHPDTIQLIYAHLPPAVILATEQHLRAQTQIEQRAQQLWFERGSRPGNALNDWLRAEREVVQNLCAALRHRRIPEPEAAAACL